MTEKAAAGLTRRGEILANLRQTQLEVVEEASKRGDLQIAIATITPEAMALLESYGYRWSHGNTYEFQIELEPDAAVKEPSFGAGLGCGCLSVVLLQLAVTFLWMR
jgi:hypothetical protein